MRAGNLKKWISGCLLVCLVGMIAGCSASSQAEILSLARKMRKNRAQADIKQSAIGKYLGNVDDQAPIVFVSVVQGKTQLHSIQPDGGKLRQLTVGPGYKCRPAWNLPHTQIAYFQYAQDQPVGDAVSVIVTQADGTNPRVVVKDRKIKAKDLRISWKPDGSVVYFQEQDFPSILYGYEVATGKQVETIRLPKNSFMTEVHSMSPDMTFLAGAGMKDNTLHIGNIRRDGKQETDFMRLFQKSSFHVGTIVWSYSGEQVAFEADQVILVMSKKINIDFEVFTISPQDFGASLSGPAFSPSSKYLACIMEKAEEGTVGSGDQNVASDVWTMNVNGTNQKQLTHTGSCFDPCW